MLKYYSLKFIKINFTSPISFSSQLEFSFTVYFYFEFNIQFIFNNVSKFTAKMSKQSR